MPLKVVTFTTVFPLPDEPGRGIFICSRMAAVAGQGVAVKVVCPVPLWDYGRLRSGLGRRAGIAPARQVGRLEVFHPRWVYPPLLNFANGLFLFAGSIGCLWRLRKTFAFDVIDAHFAQPDGVAAAMLAACLGKPFTVTLRGVEVVHARNRWRRAVMSWALRRSAGVIAVSEELARLAVELGADPRAVAKIPNGVDGAVFHPRERGEARARLGLRPEAGVIVSAGHLVRGKGHQDVIEAAARLRREGLDVDVCVVGGSAAGEPFQEELRAQVERLQLDGHVRMPGHVAPETMADYFAAADVMCLASAREGWPNVVAEALACGTPVVAYGVGAVGEMLTGPELGTVVAPGDREELAVELGRAMRQPWDRETIAQRGRSRDWSMVAEETIRVLSRAAGKSR